MEASIKQLRGAKNLFSYADTDFWNCAFAWSSPWRWGQQRRDKIQDLRKGESADEFLSRIGTVSTRDSLSLPTNLFGFSALPSGYRDETGGFYAAGTSVSWWTSTPFDEVGDYAWYRSLYSDHGRIDRFSFLPHNTGKAIRCVCELGN